MKAVAIPADVIEGIDEALAAADRAYETAKAQLGERHPITESVLELWSEADAVRKAAARG